MGTPDISLGLDEQLAPLDGSAIIASWERTQAARDGLRPLVMLQGFLSGARARPSLDALGDLPLGVRDGLLLRAHACNFGGRLPIFDRCPDCAQAVEFEIDADTLLAQQREQARERVQWTCGEWSAVVRPLTTRDLMAVADANAARPAARLIRRALEQVSHRGEAAAAADLPEDLLDEIAQRCADADPLSDLTLELRCPACGHQWESGLDIGDFLWRELSFHARRLLGQVHALASTYGWPEDTILAMTPARRGAYLGLIESEAAGPQLVGAA